MTISQVNLVQDVSQAVEIQKDKKPAPKLSPEDYKFVQEQLNKIIQEWPSQHFGD